MRVAPFVLLLACNGLASPSGPSATGPGGSSFKAGQPGASGVSGVAGSSGAQGPAGKDAQSSGSRLKVRVWRASDGFRSASGGAIDSSTGEYCIFGKAADGKMRCLPSGSTCSYFRDAGCTIPACQLPCSVGRVRTTAAVTTCGGGGETRIFEIGPKIPNDTPLHFLFAAPTGCTLANNTNATGDWYEAGDEVPASSFLEGEYVTED